MRAGMLVRLGRRDMVQMLLREGRLSDIQMVHHFSRQQAHEKQAADQSTLDSTRTAGEQSFFHTLDAVKNAASTKEPLEWLRYAYGCSTWSTSCVTADAVKAVQGPRSIPGSLSLEGTAYAVGVPGSEPTSARIAALVEGDDGKKRRAIAFVSLDQHQGRVAVKKVGNQKRIVMKDAVGTLLTDLTVEQMAAQQHVYTAAAYSGILSTLEDLCALHATSTVRHDGLLIRNPVTQMRLAQLACFRFGIDSLTSYVALNTEKPDIPGEWSTAIDKTGGHTDARDADSAKPQRPNDDPPEHDPDADLAVSLTHNSQPYIPLIESVVLNMYAENALVDGMNGAWEMMRDTPLEKALPHRSNPTRTINYPYLKELRSTSMWSLTALDGSQEEQALKFLRPILEGTKLCSSHTTSLTKNPLAALLGMTGSAPRLAAVHINLSVGAQVLERDIATLFELITKQKDKQDPMFAIAVSQYVAEVFAALAVMYRCTASLDSDEEGKGHHEWLLTQAFCTASSSRRENIIRDWRMASLATTALRGTKLDNYTTHPVQLMNALLPQKKQSVAGSSSSASQNSTTTNANSAACAAASK